MLGLRIRRKLANIFYNFAQNTSVLSEKDQEHFSLNALDFAHIEIVPVMLFIPQQKES